MVDKISDKAGVSRHDFLELSALWSVALSVFGIFLGILRIFKPNVQYEGSMRFKIGSLVVDENKVAPLGTRYLFKT